MIDSNIKNSLPILNWDNDKVGSYNLNPDVFNHEYRQDIIHEYLRWQMNKARKPIQKVRGRSEVSGAHKKIGNQKGSGKARQGDGKAPHFRGGGVAFGIHPRDYAFKLNKKFKIKALKSFLSKKFEQNQIFIVEKAWHEDFLKTNSAKRLIEKITDLSSVLIYNDTDKDSYRGIKGLINVNVLHLNGFNILSCLKPAIIIDVNSLKALETRLAKEVANG